ncbi:MAG: VacJ family lipoprotein [Legionellales bacterium]|nr:VacJ family lipoprotein [Legionellales bacterium]
MIYRQPYLLFFLILLLSGCATHKDNVDPYEGYNRAMFKFNKAIDKALIKPVAITYDTIFPYPVKKGISNVFDNLFLTSSIVNDLLQWEISWFASDTWRFLLNSTIGIAGLFDVATHIGFPKHQQDFGKTLAKWGDPNSPYFIIPIFGPSTVRDATGMIFDYSIFSVLPRIRPIEFRNSLYLLELIDFRTRLLETDDLRDVASIDEYLFTRDAYLQFRKSFINNDSEYFENNEDDEDLEDNDDLEDDDDLYVE